MSRPTADIVADLRGRNGTAALSIPSEAADRLAELDAENERLRLAILDIDAHATPLGEDDAGFVAVGYAVSVGSLHRALGLVGHTAPKGITAADMQPDFIAMLYDLVPENAGLPIGTAALIWRAARELEAIDAARPICPTCGGSGDVAPTKPGAACNHPCPDCPDGRMPFERMAAIVNAVFSDDGITIHPKRNSLGGIIDATLNHLRRVKP